MPSGVSREMTVIRMESARSQKSALSCLLCRPKLISCSCPVSVSVVVQYSAPWLLFWTAWKICFRWDWNTDVDTSKRLANDESSWLCRYRLFKYVGAHRLFSVFRFQTWYHVVPVGSGASASLLVTRVGLLRISCCKGSRPSVVGEESLNGRRSAYRMLHDAKRSNMVLQVRLCKCFDGLVYRHDQESCIHFFYSPLSLRTERFGDATHTPTLLLRSIAIFESYRVFLSRIFFSASSVCSLRPLCVGLWC